MSEMSGISSVSQNTQTVGLQQETQGIVRQDNDNYTILMDQIIQSLEQAINQVMSSTTARL